MFPGVISPDMLNECLEHISLLLVSKYRQLVGGALEFLRMFVVTYNDIHLTQYIDKIMGALNTMSKDSKLHFRMKLRRIFQRLVRKLG